MTDMSSNAQKTPVADQRVSTLVGDRICAHCFYNLMGQPVLREGHYNMLIVRCPECGTVASVQEYPLLGRWSRRWGMLLAALWLLGVLLFWCGLGGAIFGLSMGSAAIASDQYGTVIVVDFDRWVQSQSDGSTTPPGATGPAAIQRWQRPQGQFLNWWKQQDRAGFLKAAGGWRCILPWPSALMWLPLGLVAFFGGCLCAVVMIRRRALGRLAGGLLVMVFAFLMTTVPLIDIANSKPNYEYQAAWNQIVPLNLPISLLAGWAALALGLLVGRKLARVVVSALLPPRLCVSLSELWLTDGLRPPKRK